MWLVMIIHIDNEEYSNYAPCSASSSVWGKAQGAWMWLRCYDYLTILYNDNDYHDGVAMARGCHGGIGLVIRYIARFSRCTERRFG